MGTSLVVQWLRLHGPNAGGTGLIPGRVTKIPHAPRHGQKNKKKRKGKKKDFRCVQHLKWCLAHGRHSVGA